MHQMVSPHLRIIFEEIHMRFSVIIPVYNKACTIMESVQSVLAQTFKDYEIVIVNDGSTDDFGEIERVLEQYESVRIIHQENSGVSVARNTGIKNARGSYICFLDADDLYIENHLEILNNVIERYPEKSYFATSHCTLYPDGRRWSSNSIIRNYDEAFVCKNLFKLLNQRGDAVINTNSMCISKSIIEQNDFYFEPHEKIGEDTDMWFRIALKYSIVIVKAETTVYQREYSTATAKSSNTLNWVFARRIECIKQSDAPRNVKKEAVKLIDRYKMTCIRDLLYVGDKLAARKIVRELKYKTVKYFITVVLCMIPLKMSRYIIKRLKGIK